MEWTTANGLLSLRLWSLMEYELLQLMAAGGGEKKKAKKPIRKWSEVENQLW